MEKPSDKPTSKCRITSDVSLVEYVLLRKRILKRDRRLTTEIEDVVVQIGAVALQAVASEGDLYARTDSQPAQVATDSDARLGPGHADDGADRGMAVCCPFEQATLLFRGGKRQRRVEGHAVAADRGHRARHRGVVARCPALRPEQDMRA